MPLVIGRQFQFAPTAAAQLIWNHPLLHGIVGLAAGRKVWIGTTPGPVAKSAPLKLSPYGAAWSSSSTTVELCKLPVQDDTTEFTVAWAGAAVGDGDLCGHGQAGGGAAETLLQTASGSASLFYRNSALTTPTMPTLSANRAGVAACILFVAVKQALTVTIYSQAFTRASADNLNSASTTSASGALTISTIQSMAYSSDKNGAAPNAQASALAAVWTRALSLAEVRSLSVDPFQMFAR